jgi:hypothetical protein
MFGDYDLKHEGSIPTNTGAVTPLVNPIGIPTPFVYNKEYYNEPWANMKREFGPET